MAERIRSIAEIADDFDAVAVNFDNGWRAEAPTMAALFRRAGREIRAADDARAPTPAAYDAACKALHHWREEARRLAELACVEPKQMDK